MTQARYHLGVDLGTTYTAAAVVREGGSAHPEVVSLGAAAAAVPSVVFLPEDGSMVVGDAAQRRALTEPRRIAREFKRRIGDGTPLVVGGRAVPAEEIAARFVAWVVAEVEHREGGPAASVAVTHPAEWGEYKRSCLAGALAEHGLGDVTFLTEPQAAAVGYANAERIEPGSVVGVYDLGGGTFDAAVVRKLGDGGFEVLGRPTGLERLGGIDFDDRIFEHVRTAVDAQWRELDPTDTAVQTAVAGLRRECTAAKEALSADTEVMVPVMLPGIHTQVRLGRTEFEDMIRPSVVETVEALQRAIVSADVRPADLAAVLLVGGSSRIPLVSQLVSAELGRAIAVDADPKTVIAAGAALAARGPSAPPEPAVVAEPATTDVPDVAPPSPPIAFDAPPGDDDVTDPRRRRVLVLAASLAVTAACVLSASVAAGIGPVTIEEAAGELAAPGTALAAPALGTAVDSWTGEAPTATTTPGPVRPAAVSAPERPRTRTVATGATGASRVTPAPKAKPAGPVVAEPRPNPSPAPAVPAPAGPLVEEEQNSAPPPPPPVDQSSSPPPPPPPVDQSSSPPPPPPPVESSSPPPPPPPVDQSSSPPPPPAEGAGAELSGGEASSPASV